MIILAYIDLGLTLVAVLWTCLTTVSTGIRRPSLVWLLAAAAWLLFASSYLATAGIYGQGVLLCGSLAALVVWFVSCVRGPRESRQTQRDSLATDGSIALADAALALRNAGCDDDWLGEYVTLGLDDDQRLRWAEFRKQQRDTQDRRRIRMAPRGNRETLRAIKEAWEK